MSTAIEWTDETWNPVRGCRRVSAGCENCYAELIAARFSGVGQAFEGIARRRSNGEPQWTGNSAVVESRMLDPLRWQRPRRVFVNSMSDLFYEQFDDETIARVFAVMRDARRHVFQVLTKRPERMREWVAGPGYELTREAEARLPWRYRRGQSGADWTWPLPNVQLGTSVENQEAANERIPHLLATAAAVRFLSCEPLLASIENEVGIWLCLKANALGEVAEEADVYGYDRPGIGWVIVGGESGAKARPCNVEWIRGIVRACRQTGVPCFVKQLGAQPVCRNDWPADEWPGSSAPMADSYEPHHQGEIAPLALRNRKGGDPSEWPASLRVREFPAPKVSA